MAIANLSTNKASTLFQHYMVQRKRYESARDKGCSPSYLEQQYQALEHAFRRYQNHQTRQLRSTCQNS
jgi:hypothetical protein